MHMNRGAIVVTVKQRGLLPFAWRLFRSEKEGVEGRRDRKDPYGSSASRVCVCRGNSARMHLGAVTAKQAIIWPRKDRRMT